MTKDGVAVPLERVYAFWRWFSERLGEIEDWCDFADCDPRSTIVAEINAEVDALCPGFRWEIGPSGVEGVRCFTVSPSRREELRTAAEAVIRLAPGHTRWEFCAYKPPKLWHRRLVVIAGGKELEFDFAQWQCVVARGASRRGRTDVHVWPPKDLPERLALSTLCGAAELAIECELGEQFVLDRLGALTLEWRVPPPDDALPFPAGLAATGEP